MKKLTLLLIVSLLCVSAALADSFLYTGCVDRFARTGPKDLQDFRLGIHTDKNVTPSLSLFAEVGVLKEFDNYSSDIYTSHDMTFGAVKAFGKFEATVLFNSNTLPTIENGLSVTLKYKL